MINLTVRDRGGWTMRVINICEGGVLVDWDFVETKKMRFLKHGEYEVIKEVKS